MICYGCGRGEGMGHTPSCDGAEHVPWGGFDGGRRHAKPEPEKGPFKILNHSASGERFRRDVVDGEIVRMETVRTIPVQYDDHDSGVSFRMQAAVTVDADGTILHVCDPRFDTSKAPVARNRRDVLRAEADAAGAYRRLHAAREQAREVVRLATSPRAKDRNKGRRMAKRLGLR